MAKRCRLGRDQWTCSPSGPAMSESEQDDPDVVQPTPEAVICKLFAFPVAMAAVPLFLLLSTLHGWGDGEQRQGMPCLPAQL